MADLTRRQFVLGSAALAGAMAGGRSLAMPGTKPPLELSGNRFELDIGYREVNITGRPGTATVVNGSLPAPLLRWKEGQSVHLRVSNHLAVDSSIHWHGLILPSNMDGVPGISFAGIRPGEHFDYRFDVTQSGTYWYHSHSGFQEQTGLYGAIVIESREPAPFDYHREHVLLLSDWSDEAPEAIHANLRREGDYYRQDERTLGDLWRDLRQRGAGATWRNRAMWNRMRMSDRDISDVTAATYTYLLNGQPPATNWQALFRPGEKVLLRVINGSAMTLFDFRIPGLNMTVVAADGQYVEPVTVEEFRIGVAETYDVLVSPHGDCAYSLFAQAIDRGGFACGSLTPDPELRADPPALDAPPVLTHADMGMAHDGHIMMGGTVHHDHVMHMQEQAPAAPRIEHAPAETGPQVDMRTQAPQHLVGDPGIGLRDNGRRVLTYADLHRTEKREDPRDPGREIQLHLTGNMERYLWSMNGIPFADAEPLQLCLGERVRIVLVNDTMMNHPMHLHGMWSELETGDDELLPKKHTVIVQPGSWIAYQVHADAPGAWAYHCHLLYHMGGMFREVRVERKE